MHMKTISPTAMMLTKAIEDSDLTQREIADRVGFKNANIISMLKTGETRVPLERIPALATTLGLDERHFLLVAIEEYHPGVHEVLIDVLGLPLSDAELGILTMFRMASMRDEIEVEGPFKQALEGLLDLAAMANT
jgi:transcriptional regulator with XRE-family HTH domain